MEDHYFGSIQPKVAEFMAALDQELYRYGIQRKQSIMKLLPISLKLPLCLRKLGWPLTITYK